MSSVDYNLSVQRRQIELNRVFTFVKLIVESRWPVIHSPLCPDNFQRRNWQNDYWEDIIIFDT